MNEYLKGNSPFSPGQPVSAELFVGREEQIEKITREGIAQVSRGKPMAFYVRGEYGIGKSSIAKYAMRLAERDYGLHGIYTPMGGVKDLTDLASAVLRATIRSGAYDSSRSAKIREFLAKYIGKQGLFGININMETLKQDAPSIASNYAILDFLDVTLKRLEGTGAKGIFLILDEINGIASNPDFAHFLKGFVEINAMLPKPVPILLMLCGVEERRLEMIKNHQPVERLFVIVEIETLSEKEMNNFFISVFQSVDMTIEPGALKELTFYSAGFPKIMQEIGDAAYWTANENVVDMDVASGAILRAAKELGNKYINPQIYDPLKSDDYKSILKQIAEKTDHHSLRFEKKDIEKSLSESEKKKFGNFLQKMKKLQVIKSGDKAGEYIFIQRMTHFYIWLNSKQ